MKEMDFADIHDFYENNRIELTIAFAKQRNKENKLQSVASQQEATAFFAKKLEENNIHLKCSCINTFGHLLVHSVESMKLEEK